MKGSSWALARCDPACPGETRQMTTTPNRVTLRILGFGRTCRSLPAVVAVLPHIWWIQNLFHSVRSILSSHSIWFLLDVVRCFIGIEFSVAVVLVLVGGWIRVE